MPNYITPKPWHRISPRPTDEVHYLNRRELIKKIGLATGSCMISSVLVSCQSGKDSGKETSTSAYGNHFYFKEMEKLYPAKRNERYTLDRPITDEYPATHQNNFYEFISRQDPNIYNVYKFVDDFDNRDWKIEVTGLAKNTGVFSLEDLLKRFPLEERTYRFRCVERWSMAVPWTGFPLSKLINFLQPQSNTRFVRFESYANADEMEGVRNLTHYPWPYFEGLTMAEATNQLAFLATGLYGKPIPKQNGAPVRLVVPWKYGYKNIKSIVKIDFTDRQPETFWHTIAPEEYPFTSNVEPQVPHPRWSQAFEQMIPDGEKRPTLPYNGYGEFVAHLYE